MSMRRILGAESKGSLKARFISEGVSYEIEVVRALRSCNDTLKSVSVTGVILINLTESESKNSELRFHFLSSSCRLWSSEPCKREPKNKPITMLVPRPSEYFLCAVDSDNLVFIYLLIIGHGVTLLTPTLLTTRLIFAFSCKHRPECHCLLRHVLKLLDFRAHGIIFCIFRTSQLWLANRLTFGNIFEFRCIAAATNHMVGSVKQVWINVCFYGTVYLPLPQPNINTNFSLWAKC